MIVEDEFIVRIDIQSRLRSFGYDVPWGVASGERALQEIEGAKPDLILMDVKLKGEIDGIETTKRILLKSKIPIIFLTAHTDEETLKRINSVNPTGCISKPFTDVELQAVVEKALQS